MKRWGIR